VKLHIPVCHLEAGLRSFDWAMPEEHNRRLTDHVSTLLLTHSAEAHENLAAEGIPAERIAFVGNTMIDTLFQNVDKARALEVWKEYGVEKGDYVLVTLHRPALVDDAELLTRTVAALGVVAEAVPVVFPVHPRTRRQIEELGLEVSGRIELIEPQPYGRFLSLESAAMAVVTDSGGVQEETTALGIRCFTLRNNTERPVTVRHGTNIVLGLDPDRLAAIPDYLELPLREERPPLWDGHAGERAADEIEAALGIVRSGASGAAAVARRPEPL
jgi:UDP-N-acetylglucosamine 2-epimerase (non-hydrolysing)